MPLYALQLSKEYEYFDQSYLGEIIGTFHFDHESKENKKKIISEVIAHPEKYPLIWSQMAHSLTRVRNYLPEYQDRALKEVEGEYENLPKDFRELLESVLEMGYPGKNLFLDFSEEELQEILPNIVKIMNEADQYNLLFDNTPWFWFELSIKELNPIKMD